MDYKKEIIEMIEEIHDEQMIKFIYGCVKRAYKEERVEELNESQRRISKND